MKILVSKSYKNGWLKRCASKIDQNIVESVNVYFIWSVVDAYDIIIIFGENGN